MSKNNQTLNDENSLIDQNSDNKETISSNLLSKESSATTPDIPNFGWSAYAERINGRFAMIGFIAILIIELLSKQEFIVWSGLIH